MAIPQPLRTSALQAAERYCEDRIPAHVRDQIRMEASIRGNALVIVERRPPWRDDYGPEWTSQRIARLLYHPATATWSLWWCRSNDRWEKYEQRRPARKVATLLKAIDADPYGVFYG